MNLSPKQKECLLKLSSGPLLIAEYQARHFKFTTFGEDYLKELHILISKGCIELLPPTDQELFCRLRKLQ
jgi:hypothetical protein